MLSCSFATLAPGASTTDHVVSPTTAASGGTIINTVTVVADNTAAGTASAAATITVLAPDLRMIVASDSPTVFNGRSANFTLTASNAGAGEARGVVLTDFLPGSDLSWAVSSANIPGCAIVASTLTCGPASLAPGGSLSVRVTSAPAITSAPTLNNTGGSRARQPAPTVLGGAFSTATATVAVFTSLTLTKAADATTISTGDTAGYTLTLHIDPASPPAASIVISDELPQNAGLNWTIEALETDGVSGFDCDSTLRCTLPSFAAGNRFSVHLTSPTTAATAGTLHNRASFSSGNLNDGATDYVDITVQPPSLQLTLAADSALINSGDTAGFALQLRNTGAGQAYGATISSPMPTAAGLAWAISPHFASLAPCAEVSVHVVSPTIATSASALSTAATFSCTNGNSGTTPSARITIQAATVNAGSAAGFTLEVTNIGLAPAHGLALATTLPGAPGLAWSVGPAVAGPAVPAACSIAAGALSCALGDLAPKSSASVHFKSPTAYASAGTLATTATASCFNGEAATSQPASITVTAPKLLLSKTAGASPISIGDTASYSLVLKNTGTGKAVGVTLTDPLPAAPGLAWSLPPVPGCAITAGTLSCGPSDLAAGMTLAVTLASPTTSASAGTISNTASFACANCAGGSSSKASIMAPALALTNTADKALIHAGEPAGFTLRLRNRGAGSAKGA
ncbi:hypothetical protein ABPG75_001198 [Micractinium tetrahymenae]